jgi:glycosyltransferase involved in cell wall biosynthesis
MMASGTPLVATPVGGIGSVATDGVTARLVPERDSRALAAAIGSLIRERPMALALGRQAREVVCKRHSWSRVAADFESVYERC